MADVSFTVEPAQAGKRLDAFLAGASLGLTRSQAERLVKDGRVTVDGRPVVPGRRLAAGEIIEISLPEPAAREVGAERIPLDILFEDDDLIVINKPRGMVVHPGAGRTSGTLVNALLAHTPNLAAGSGSHRPGIVHRLDRDTSGLLVIAKTDAAYASLSRQVRRREMERRYLALVWGEVREDRLLIDVPIGRHRRERKRMAAVVGSAEGRALRAAHTDVAVLERFGMMTLVEARLGTGRTHQIRVHLAHIGHPVVGDPVYGLRQARRQKAALPAEVLALVQQLSGQALHAHYLRFEHPARGQELSFSAPMPPDLARLVSHLAGGVPIR
jgi:23S rRNA pseudouridine1911/1915/1917 synthase